MKCTHRMRVYACHLAACGAAFIVSAGNAFAQPASVANCHAIPNDAQRLACYDAATARPTTAPREAAPLTPIPAGPASAPEQPARPTSMLDESWGFDPASPRYVIGFHRPNYLLPVRYTSDVNNRPFTPLFTAAGVPPQDLDDIEAKFQLSFKARVWTTDDRRWGVWGAYTQQSHWQVYHSDEQVSKPFRETNYMPELFLSFRPGIELPGGFNWRLINAGYVHQSNGRSDPLSRSWDRLFAELGVDRDNLALSLRGWFRLKEDSRTDDNPDITDYYGYAELSGLYRWRDHSFLLSGRGNWNTGKGAIHAAWTSPRLLGLFRGYVQFTSGYGESMIDYNHKQTTIGAGIALSDGL